MLVPVLVEGRRVSRLVARGRSLVGMGGGGGGAGDEDRTGAGICMGTEMEVGDKVGAGTETGIVVTLVLLQER